MRHHKPCKPVCAEPVSVATASLTNRSSAPSSKFASSTSSSSSSSSSSSETCDSGYNFDDEDSSLSSFKTARSPCHAPASAPGGISTVSAPLSEAMITGTLETAKQRAALKAKLSTLLQHHDGEAGHPLVQEVLEELYKLSDSVAAKDLKGSAALPVPAGTVNPNISPHLLGLTVVRNAPHFHGRLSNGSDDAPSTRKYTLGTISFKVFEPHDLVCTLRSIHSDMRPMSMDDVPNVVRSIILPPSRACTADLGLGLLKNVAAIKDEDDVDNAVVYSSTLWIDIVLHTPHGDLTATLQNDAIAFPHPTIPNRLKVVYVSGQLIPTDDTFHNHLSAWRATFAGVYARAARERSLVSNLFIKMVQWMVGLSPPRDKYHVKDQVKDQQKGDSKEEAKTPSENSKATNALVNTSAFTQGHNLLCKDKDSAVPSIIDTFPSSWHLRQHAFRFDMHRAHAGFTDILYMDETLRITRGNRGAIVIVDRV